MEQLLTRELSKQARQEAALAATAAHVQLIRRIIADAQPANTEPKK